MNGNLESANSNSGKVFKKMVKFVFMTVTRWVLMHSFQSNL